MADLVFPMEKAKELRDDPEQRYRFALDYLPLPAAFREAAKGLRAMIRERKREEEPYEEPLRRLYRMACVRNLVMTERVLSNERLPGELWQDAEFPYEAIGYEKLELLGTRDRQRMEKLWGEPEAHRDVGEIVPELRARFVQHSQAVRARMDRELQKRREQIRQGSPSPSGQSGCLGSVLVGIVLLALLA